MDNSNNNGSSRLGLPVPSLVFQHPPQHARRRSPTKMKSSHLQQGFGLNMMSSQHHASNISMATSLPVATVPIAAATQNSSNQPYSTSTAHLFPKYPQNMLNPDLLMQQHRQYEGSVPAAFYQKASPTPQFTIQSTMTSAYIPVTSHVQMTSSNMHKQSSTMLPRKPQSHTQKVISSNMQKRIIPRKMTGVVKPSIMHKSMMSSGMQSPIASHPLTSSTDIRHEMQQQHFESTIAKARQAPVLNSNITNNHIPQLSHPTSSQDLNQNIVYVGNSPPHSISSNLNSVVQVDTNNLQSIVLASMMAAVNSNKSTPSLTIRNPKKKRKRPKKPPLKVNRVADLPTMVPQLLDSSEKQYKCPDCPRMFSWQFQLQQHSRTHSGERPFVCSECKQAYKRREHLQRHERVHTGERPFDCADCGKKYRRRSQLVRHNRVHTGERPYICSICSKAFRRRGHLCRHFKTHANEILKKSGINPTSLQEASALLTETLPPVSQSSLKNQTINHSFHDNHVPPTVPLQPITASIN